MSRRDRGQAAVELAIATPVVIVLVLGIVQVVVVAGRYAAIDHLARNGARAASVAADPHAAATAHIRRSTELEPLDISVRTGPGTVTVTVGYTDPTSVPVIGAAIGAIRLEASATMPREPP